MKTTMKSINCTKALELLKDHHCTDEGGDICGYAIGDKCDCGLEKLINDLYDANEWNNE